MFSKFLYLHDFGFVVISMRSVPLRFGYLNTWLVPGWWCCLGVGAVVKQHSLAGRKYGGGWP